AQKRAPDTARDAVLFSEQRPYLPSRFQDTKSYKEKILFPGAPVDVSPVRLRFRLVPKGPSPCPVGNINPLPFRSAARQKTSMCLVSGDVSLGKGFSDPLWADALFNCCSHGNPFSPSVPKVFTLDFLLPQDLHRGRLQAGHPAPFKSTPPDPPTHAG
ncbi:hypothetical protein JTE90_014068, partial [Oedothorax gibbosus]